MATLLDQLQRESEDLCGHRGLLAGTDDQTFSMALPIKLRNYYDKIVIPATTMGSAMPTGPRAHKLTGNFLMPHLANFRRADFGSFCGFLWIFFPNFRFRGATNGICLWNDE